MLYFLVGLVAGFIIALFIFGMRISTAVLRIDNSDKERPICRLDLNNIDLKHKSLLVLTIDHKADLSQK